MTSFFLAGAEHQLRDYPLIKMKGLIDWESIRSLLRGIYRRDQSNGGGPEPYDSVLMFRLMLLGQWHQLSDVELEHALSVGIMCIEGRQSPPLNRSRQWRWQSQRSS